MAVAPLNEAERTSIIKLVVGMFNAAPGAQYLNDIISVYMANGKNLAALAQTLSTTNAYRSINPDFQTATEFATAFLTPLGLNSNAVARDFIISRFNAGVPKWQITVAALVALENTTSSEFTAAKAILNNKTEVAIYYSVTKSISSTSVSTLQSVVSGVTAESSSVTTAKQNIDNGNFGGSGTVFTLTTAIDNLNGTAGNDTFQGLEANFGSLDTINGGDGTDNLVLALTSATNSISGSQVSNVETLTISQSTNAGTVTVGATGITKLVNSGSTTQLTVNGLTTLAALEISNNAVAAGTTVNYAEAAAAGTADAVSVTLNNVTNASAVAINTVTATATVAGAIEIVNLVSSGTAANSITLSTNDTEGMTTLNISGSAALTVAMGDNVATDVTTIDASKATGNVSVTGIGAGNNVSGTAIGHTITGGTGNDTFALGANYIGAEASAASGTRDVINGGEGTDTLSITTARAVAASTTVQANLTSIEALTLSDALTNGQNIDVTRFSDVTRLNLATGTTGTNSVTLKGGSTVVLGGNTVANSATTFTVSGTGTTDALTLNMAGFDFLGTGTETFSGVETLNINTGATVTDAAVFADALTLSPSPGVTNATVVVTGANAATFTGVITGVGTLDASALTGVLTVTAAPAAGITIKGGTAADVITGSAGNDLIVGGNGADVITMGAGNDSIDLTEATAAIDKVVFATVADSDTAAQALAKTGLNVITGFGTTDQLNIAGLGDGSTTATGLTTLSAPAAQSAFADDTVYIVNTSGAAASLTTGGTASVTDFTNTTQVAAYLNERFTLADATIEGVVVFNQTGTSYIYQVSGDGTPGFQTADIALVGTVAQTAALTTANLVYA